MNTDHDRNPKHWKLGLFYYNPLDPSLFVERKVGTLVFARVPLRYPNSMQSDIRIHRAC